MSTTKPGTVPCMCGCTGAANIQFQQGHDAKLLSKLLRAHRSGQLVDIYDIEYRPDFYAARVSPQFAGLFQEHVAGTRR